MSVAEGFADFYQWTVTSGGTDAPGAGIQEMFTVASTTGEPPAATGLSEFWIVDQADQNVPPEYMKVTNESGSTWTVTRAAAGHAPWAHAPNWTALPVLTAEGLSNALATAEPPGVIKQYGGIYAPSGYLLCNGAAYSRTTYARLFNAISIQTTGTTGNGSNIITAIPDTTGMGVGMPVSGTNIPTGATITSVDTISQVHISANASASTSAGVLVVAPFGVGDGSTTFNVPDLRGRAPVGAGTGTGLTGRVLGVKGGEENHTLVTGELAAHNHAASDSGHGHGLSDGGHSHSTVAGQIGNIVQLDANQTVGLAGGTNVAVKAGGESANTTSANGTGATVASGTANVTTTNTGGGTGHNNMQPFVGVNHIIKV